MWYKSQNVFSFWKLILKNGNCSTDIWNRQITSKQGKNGKYVVFVNGWTEWYPNISQLPQHHLSLWVTLQSTLPTGAFDFVADHNIYQPQAIFSLCRVPWQDNQKLSCQPVLHLHVSASTRHRGMSTRQMMMEMALDAKSKKDYRKVSQTSRKFES